MLFIDTTLAVPIDKIDHIGYVKVGTENRITHTYPSSHPSLERDNSMH